MFWYWSLFVFPKGHIPFPCVTSLESWFSSDVWDTLHALKPFGVCLLEHTPARILIKAVPLVFRKGFLGCCQANILCVLAWHLQNFLSCPWKSLNVGPGCQLAITPAEGTVLCLTLAGMSCPSQSCLWQCAGSCAFPHFGYLSIQYLLLSRSYLTFGAHVELQSQRAAMYLYSAFCGPMGRVAVNPWAQCLPHFLVAALMLWLCLLQSFWLSQASRHMLDRLPGHVMHSSWSR